MNNRWVIVGALFIVALMVAASIVATLKIDLTPKQEKPGRRPARTQNLGEGIKISQHGLYGVDLVSIGKVHMRKLRRGPFTIGAINELVLENVALVLPEDVWKGEEKGERGENGEKGEKRNGQPQTSNSEPQTSPKAMLSKLGIQAGNLKMGGTMPRFSALQIRGLVVSRLEGTNAVPWFAAKRGEAGRSGLELSRVWSVEGGKTNVWNEALLVVEPSLRLLPRR